MLFSFFILYIFIQGVYAPEEVGVGYSQMAHSKSLTNDRGVNGSSENKIAEEEINEGESRTHKAMRGTRDDPIPKNTAADIGKGWWIRVLEVYPNANEIVAKENKHSSPPKQGQQYFLARVELKYLGPDSSEFAADNRFKAVGPSSVVYSPYGINPGVIPDKLDNAEAFTGGTVVGNIGWAINSSDANRLVMFDSRASKDNRIFLALY